MTVNEILEQTGDLLINQKREMTDRYGEIVISNEELEQWNRHLSEKLGPAIKLPDVEPTEEHHKETQEYGGIRIDQTLYKKKFDDMTCIAMFWPWMDQRHTTLKIILY